MRLRPKTLLCLVFVLTLMLGYIGIQLWQAQTTPTSLPPAETEWMDINQVSFRELATLPGIGVELARRIVAQREAQQGFTHLTELPTVRGIGKKKLARIISKLRILPEKTKK
ncbi:helix-hairpin-helix domain-containing protein [bacterium]|nr:helix-hairpin-helix domain-containing protein [bacterium]